MTSQKPFMRIRPRGWLITVPVALGLLLSYRYMGAMSTDTLFSVNAGCQFLLIIVGVIVAVKPQSAVEHPWRVIAAFMLLGGIGMVAAVRQQQISARETAEAQRQAAEASVKLANSIDNLNKGAAEISRVQALNTELQQRLLETTEQTANQLTGADSFCVFLADFSESLQSQSGDGKIKFLEYSVDVIVHGKYAMNDVTASYTAREHPLYPGTEYGLGEKTTWLPGKTQGVGIMALGRHDITVNSRNGKLTQTLVLGKTNGKLWQQAVVRRDGKTIYSFSTK